VVIFRTYYVFTPLPTGITLEQLRLRLHRSVRRNPQLAQIFYYAGFIEQWGTGTTRMIDLCRAQDLPDPEYAEETNGFRVTFSQDPYTPERLQAHGLSERQMRIVQAIRERGQVQLGDLTPLFPHLSAKTIQRELRTLVEQGLLRALGERKGRQYELAR
jgi:ATP-dependent DNA helicase RecG